MIKRACLAVIALSCALMAQNQASDNTVVVGNPAQPVQWEHKGDIQAAILRAGPNGTVWIPAGYKGTECNPISVCNPGTTAVIDWRSGGGLNLSAPGPIGTSIPNTGAFTTLTIGSGLVSLIMFNPPDPFCMLNNLGEDQLCDLIDPSNGNSALAWNPDGSVNQRVFTTAFQSTPYLDGSIWGFNAQVGLPAVLPNINISSQTGEITQGAQASNGGSLVSGSLSPAFDAIRVSTYCASVYPFTTCPGAVDESKAIVAAEAACASGGGTNSSCHIVDDMCGTQTISVQPFNLVGQFDFRSNCSANSPHIWSLDGIGTLTTPHSGLIINGMGGNGFLQSPTNVYIQACNTIIDNCVNGGFKTPTVNLTSFTVAGALGTLVLASPIATGGSGPAQGAVGRGLYVWGSSTANTNGLWIIQTVTDSTHYVVGVVNGTTTTCTTGCGGAQVTLDTPTFEIGASTGGAVFDVRANDLLFNCHYVIGCTGPVNGVGQENTGWGMTHVSNTDTWYYRLEQSAAYNGSASNGDVNSGPYGPMTGNINPEVCNHTGGCACKVGTANGACPSSPQPVGTLMTCGAGTSGTAAIISPDPCLNSNFAGIVATGVGGAQGPREILGATISIQDKTATATAIVGLRGGVSGASGSVTATSSTGILICGSRFTALDTHIEFIENAVEVGCNDARNATWYGEYSGFITNAVSFTGGLWGFQNTGVGVDIGKAGNGAFIQDACFNNIAIGANSGTILTDNIYGITLTGTANEQGESYCHGHSGTFSGSAPGIGVGTGKLTLVNPLTVSTLPAAASNIGALIVVTDSTAISAEGQTCVGSSTNKALAFSNGTVWKCF